MDLRTNLIALMSIVFAFAPTAHGAGRYVKVDYPASAAADELPIAVTYTLWIPDGVKTLRGIIVHQHGAGTTASIEGSTAAYDLHWQALAKKWDCALLGPSYHVLNEKTDTTPGGSELWFDPRRGSEKVFLKALTDLAAKAGHREVETVPWALWGHSGGGIWADVMTTLHPDRVVAVFMRSGSAVMFLSHPEFTRPKVPAALYSIPMICNPGVKEKPKTIPDPDTRTPEEKMKGPWLGNLATFHEYRAKGGLIAFAPDPRTGHECGDSRYLAIPFLDACLAMRLPDKGSRDQTLKPMDLSQAWLAPLLGDEAQPAAAFKGDVNEAVWLPNAAVAKAWMEYVKTGATTDATPPPAPVAVKAAAGDQGVEITWSAEADFESGIGWFIVMRDGQELAKVPENPVGKFGRPLFQSMTYHDTPAQPMPAMRYLDQSAKAREKHAYSVITVNGAGLKSEPSASVTVAAQAQTPFYQFVNATQKFTDDQISWSFGERGPYTTFGQAKEAAAKMGGGGRMYFKIEVPATSGGKPEVYKDFIEYTHNASGWHGNTTQVDEFVIPMTIELFNADGTSKKCGIGESRAALFEAFRKEAPKEFQSCVIGTERIVSPCRADFRKGQANGNYFDKYIDEVWAMYATEKTTPGGWTGKVVDGALIFSKPGQKDYVLHKKPSTQDVFLGENELGKSADWCSAINRHVMADPGDWRKAEAYYKVEPCNFYAKFFHEHSIGKLAYGFCYDDFNQQAAYFEGRHPTKLVVTVCWDAPVRK